MHLGVDDSAGWHLTDAAVAAIARPRPLEWLTQTSAGIVHVHVRFERFEELFEAKRGEGGCDI